MFLHSLESAVHKVEYSIPDKTFLVWVMEDDFVLCPANYVPFYMESLKKKERWGAQYGFVSFYDGTVDLQLLFLWASMINILHVFVDFTMAGFLRA